MVEGTAAVFKRLCYKLPFGQVLRVPARLTFGRVGKHLVFWMMSRHTHTHKVYVLEIFIYKESDSKMLHILSVRICSAELIIPSSNFSY